MNIFNDSNTGRTVLVDTQMHNVGMETPNMVGRTWGDHKNFVKHVISKYEIVAGKISLCKPFKLQVGPLYTRSQGRKNLRPTLSIFGLFVGFKLQINARTLMSGY